MFRPNRIGEHHITDLSAANFEITPSIAEFALSLGTISEHQVQTDSAVLGDPVSTVNFDTGSGASAYVLLVGESYSFGRFITGAALNEREMMISYSGSIMARSAANTSGLQIALNCGIHNTTSVTVDDTTTTNLMDTRCILAMNRVGLSTQINQLVARGTILNTLFNGGASGIYDTNPLGFWFSLTNLSGATITVNTIEGSLSIYRYSRDVDTFDPNR